MLFKSSIFVLKSQPHDFEAHGLIKSLHSTTSTHIIEMAGIRCFCGSSFADEERFKRHATAQGHRLLCGCGALFKTETGVLQHQRDVPHHAKGGYIEHFVLKAKQPVVNSHASTSSSADDTLKCCFCPAKKPFGDWSALKLHQEAKHPTCPATFCKMTFHDKKGSAAQLQLMGHQKASGHCYCAEHDEFFKTMKDFEAHKREIGHIDFKCADCDRQFTTEQGFDDHLKVCNTAERKKEEKETEERAAAAFAKAEEDALRCEACDRDFRTLKGLLLHRNSVSKLLPW
jgi:hypothetical protein